MSNFAPPDFVQPCLQTQPDFTRGRGAPCALPPAYLQCASNLAKWLPEVLLLLGAPDLEENFQPARVNITDSSQGRAMEVTLERWPADMQGTGASWRSPPLASTAQPASRSSFPPPPIPRAASPSGFPRFAEHHIERVPVMQSLERLATQYEELASRVSARVSSHPQVAETQWQPNTLQSHANTAEFLHSSGTVPAPVQMSPAQLDLMTRFSSLTEGIALAAASLRAASSNSTSSQQTFVDDGSRAYASAFPASQGSSAHIRVSERSPSPALYVDPGDEHKQLSQAVTALAGAAVTAAPMRTTQEDEVTPRGRRVRQGRSKMVVSGARTAGLGQVAPSGRSNRAQAAQPPRVADPTGLATSSSSNPKGESSQSSNPKSLSVSVHKHEFLEEPASPKFVTKSTAWGGPLNKAEEPAKKADAKRTDSPKAQRTLPMYESTLPHGSNDGVDAEAIKTRIQKKLVRLFGESQATGPGQRSTRFQSVP